MVEWMSGNPFIILLALGMLALAIWRVLRRPELLAGEGAVAWDAAEAAGGAADGPQLRLALFNPGRQPLAAGTDIGPLRILAPEGARITRVETALQRGVSGQAAPQLHPDGGRIELPPFALATGGEIILDIWLDGPSAPPRIIGRARRVGGWLRRRGDGAT